MNRKLYLIEIIMVNFISAVSFALTPKEILQKMDAVRSYKTAQMAAAMTIIDKNGTETKMRLLSYEKNAGDKSIMIFTYPPRLKNTAILMVGDKIWYYNRRTNRVRLLSRAAKKGSMMGSGFSYNDISLDYEKDFTANIVKEDDKKYILKLFPKDEDRSYKYLIAEVPKEHYIITKCEYFKESNLKFKEMVASNLKRIKNYLIPLNIEMFEIGNNKTTKFMIDGMNVKYDVELKDSLFSERNLKR